MELIEVKSLIWAQKGKLYIIYEKMIDRQYSSYCFLASKLSIEKKIKYSRQVAYSQSMGFAIIISHAQ
jgi:hypothetical protein